MLLAGRGSDEAIDLLIRSYCRAGHDAVMICPPTFGMYGVAARIQGAAVHRGAVAARAPATRSTPSAAAGAQLRARRVKLVFLCSPNNPTGNRFDARSRSRAGARARGPRAAWWSMRPMWNSPTRRSLAAELAALPGLVRAAHAVQGPRPGRRALRRADRAPGGGRAAAQGDSALCAHAADHRGGVRSARARGAAAGASASRRSSSRARARWRRRSRELPACARCGRARPIFCWWSSRMRARPRSARTPRAAGARSARAPGLCAGTAHQCRQRRNRTIGCWRACAMSGAAACRYCSSIATAP